MTNIVSWIVTAMLVLPTAQARVERVSPDQGIPLHLIYCMTQTRDGFLWFGTMYGLVRFDGYSYRSFRYDPADSTTLSNDDIISLYEDGRGDLWVGTYGGGVNRLDRSSGVFHRYHLNSTGMPDVVWAIREDRSGRVLLGTENDGLLMMTPERGLPRTYGRPSPLSDEMRKGPVTSIDVGQEGELWAVVGGRLLCYLPSSGSVQSVELGTREGNPVLATTVLIGDSGTVWIGTSGHGVYSYSLETRSLTPVTGPPDGQPGENLFRTNVIVRGDSGFVYAGTSKGVVVIDPRGVITGSYRRNPASDASLFGDGVMSLCKDQGAILWVSSYTLGLAKIHPNERPFRTFFRSSGASTSEVVGGVIPVGPSRVLVSASARLYEVKLSDGKVTEIPLPPQTGSERRRVSSLCRDRSGDIWLGTGNGLLLLTPDYQIRKIYRHNPADSTSLSSDLILCIIQDRVGDVWVGTAAGLNRLMPGRKEFKRYSAGPGELKNDYILSLYEDGERGIWIGTYGGTSVLNPDRHTFLHFLQDPSNPEGISSNYALTYCEDEEGTLWIGTGGGLNRFNRSTGTFSHFLARHGLPNAVVTGILDEGNGVLWLSTHFGLARLHVSTGNISSYDVRDGLGYNMFFPGTAARTSDGLLVFGGHGITVFDPGAIHVSNFSPKVEITSFEPIGSPDTLRQSVLSGDTLYLFHDQNHFTVEFSALDFLRPSRALYSYKLEGVDNDWSARGTGRTATYSNLTPGSYLLRIRGTNGDGIWSVNEATLTLEVSPPFWGTLWFTALSVALLAGLLVTAHRVRLKRKLRRIRELDQARQEAAEAIRKKAARDFHDELGHRLTKIGLFAELVRKRIGRSSPEATAHLAKIIESAQGLTDETRNFLWSLDPGEDSLFDLLRYLNGFGEELFDRTGITFHPAEVTETMRDCKLTMDFRRHVGLILKEAMNNALKHSGCSNISLSAMLQGGDLSLSLDDDGRGYSPGGNGSGNGVRNMRMRAERIRGAVQIESNPGVGTRVVFASSLA